MDPLTSGLLAGGGSFLGNLLSGIGGRQAGGIASQGALNAGMMGALGANSARDAYGQYFGIARDALNPFINAGHTSINDLMSAIHGTGAKDLGIGGGGANLLSTFAPTQAQLEQTPGYQFNLSQGTQAAQNSAAGRGLGYSGNAMKSGVDYASGLASTTYQQQLQNYMAQNQQAYNMLLHPAQLGQTAAGQLGQFATQTGQNIGASTAGAYNALAGGLAGSANALAGGQQSWMSGLGAGLAGAAGGLSYGLNNQSPFPSRGYNANYNVGRW